MKNIEEFNTSNYVQIIEEQTFQNSSLKTLVIPKSVNKLGNEIFHNFNTLISVEFEKEINLKVIARSAFHHCISLQRIHLSDFVQTILSSAFNQCSSLNYIHMYDNIEYIGSYAFYRCESLTLFKTVTSSKESPLKDENDNNGNVVIPNSVTEISSYLFEFCYKIKNIKLHKNIKIIEKQSFHKCVSLESINLPNSINNIWIKAFESCISLKEIKIPGSVSIILLEAFVNCSSLKKVSIGNDVRSIEPEIFLGVIL